METYQIIDQDEPIKSAIYARVSPTKHIKSDNDIHQSIDESLTICRKDALNEDNIVVKEYIDQYVSGKTSKNMPAFNQMLNDAKGGLFKRIYCRRVNRFGRNRNDMITAEIELTKIGVSLKFVENGIDTSKPFGKSIMGILAELAQQERDEILENTHRGREYAKEHGTKTGRPFGQPRKEINIKAIRQLRILPVKERHTWKILEKDFGVSRTIMIKRLKEHGFWDFEKGCVK